MILGNIEKVQIVREAEEVRKQRLKAQDEQQANDTIPSRPHAQMCLKIEAVSAADAKYITCR